jgi:hypothetical protein
MISSSDCGAVIDAIKAQDPGKEKELSGSDNFYTKMCIHYLTFTPHSITLWQYDTSPT